jgi:hypothetical protein
MEEIIRQKIIRQKTGAKKKAGRAHMPDGSSGLFCQECKDYFPYASDDFTICYGCKLMERANV